MVNLGAEHENLDQKAYSILKDLIIERKLLPGQKIPQEKLARDLGCRFIPLSELKSLPYQIIVNATPAGMAPDVDSIPISSKLLEPETVVMDMVYNPLKTRFLKEAETIGCAIVDGVSMFVHQGAVQFELWTDQKAPVDIMRRVVLEELESQ